MNTVVYSASPLWIFMSTFLGLGIVMVLGVFGLLYAIFRRREKMFQRIIMAVLGLFLCAVGVLGLGFTGLSILNGANTATVLLNNKRIAEDNCGDNGDTCTRLVLETGAGTHSYDFTVEQRAFDATEKGGCYRVTYYLNQGLFGTTGTDLYVASDHVTRIEQMQPGECR